MGFEGGEDVAEGYYPSEVMDKEDNLDHFSGSDSGVSLPCSQNSISQQSSQESYSSDCDCETQVLIPATIEQTAKDIAFDICYYVSCIKHRKASSNHASTLRRTVDEMSQKHEILFNGMVKKLEISLDNAFIIFCNVANEIFKDEQYNWGRVVSLYAFGARIAKHVADKTADKRIATKSVEKVAKFIGDYVTKELGVWIHKQGGWDVFDEHFPEQLNIESAVLKGLLVTALGLGALATIAAVR